jgi:hypothetical protein
MFRERRRATRQDALIPARIDSESRADRLAISRNLSRTGALLGTPSRFRIGERTWLSFQLDGECVSEISGRIVRLELNHDDDTGIWRFLMAVQFHEPLPDSFLIQAREMGY